MPLHNCPNVPVPLFSLLNFQIPAKFNDLDTFDEDLIRCFLGAGWFRDGFMKGKQEHALHFVSEKLAHIFNDPGHRAIVGAVADVSVLQVLAELLDDGVFSRRSRANDARKGSVVVPRSL
jgi:hypothetical protein